MGYYNARGIQLSGIGGRKEEGEEEQEDKE